MPSKVVAQVAKIENLRPHNNADRLELATINGWQIVCGKGSYKEGDTVIYVTPDSLITQNLAETLGVKQHLGSVKNPDGTFVTNEEGDVMLRVRQAKLRGEPSFGTTIPNEVAIKHFGMDLTKDSQVGENLAEYFGVAKYEPQMRASAGDAEVDNPNFFKYTSMENLRNYPNLIAEGEETEVTLKIHGTNSRIGSIDGEIMAGSHGLRRKKPEENMEKNLYWFPYTLESVQKFLRVLGSKFNQVILYGEIYGNVQKKYNYGIPNGIGFRAFDIMIDGKYVGRERFNGLCATFDIPRVPVLIEKFAYNKDELIKFAEEKVSTLTKFHDKIVDAEVFLKVQNTSDKENKITEVKINIPGSELIIKRETKTFEEGLNAAVDNLKRQLKKSKEKHRNSLIS